MSRRSKYLVLAVALIAIAVALWLGGRWFLQQVIALHGGHPH
jgi:hypothetical protein